MEIVSYLGEGEIDPTRDEEHCLLKLIKIPALFSFIRDDKTRG